MTILDLHDAPRIDVGGIKLSPELVQLNCTDAPGQRLRGARLFHCMADHRINLPFVCLGTTPSGQVSSCCVDAEDMAGVHRFLQLDPDLGQHVELIAPVGTVTIFPHRSDTVMMGLVMAQFAQGGFPVYGLATSISALTISTDYRLLDHIVEKLRAVLALPPHHGPLRPQLRIQQIRP